MGSIKDGTILIPVKEINWMDAEMRTKGFGADGASDTFCHKEYQHVWGEHIAQKGMLKHDCSCMDTYAPVFFLLVFLSPALLTMHRQTRASPSLILRSGPIRGLSAQ